MIVIATALACVLMGFKILVVVRKLSAAPKLMTFGDVSVEQRNLIEGYLTRVSPKWRDSIGLTTSKLWGNLFSGNIFGDSIVNSITITNSNDVFDVVLAQKYRGQHFLAEFVMRIEANEIIREDASFTRS